MCLEGYQEGQLTLNMTFTVSSAISASEWLWLAWCSMTMDGPWVQHLGGQWVHHGLIKGVPWVNNGFTKVAPWVHHGCNNGLTKGAPWVIKGVPWVNKGCTMGSQRVHHGCSNAEQCS